MILASLAALGATVVAFVLIPIFSSEKRAAIGVSHAEHERIDLEEKKSRLYEAISDLDFEKAAGKVSEADYANARDDYLTQMAEVMARLDALAPETTAPEKPVKKPKRSKGRGASRDRAESAPTRRCTACEAENPEAAKFCVQCGKALAPGCASCGHELPEGARFCPSCGEKTA